MNARERKQIFNQIREQYSKEMWIREGDCGLDKRPYSYVMHRIIVMHEGTFESPTEWDILTLLHEIGHVKTNTQKMKVYEKEYSATQWSAYEARKIGIPVNDLWREAFQDYIWKKRQMCINKKGKNVANKEALIVKW